MVVMVKNFDKSLFNLRNTSVHVSATNYYPEQLALQSSSFGYIFRKYLKIIGTANLALHAVARAPYDDRLAAPLLPFQLDVVHGIGPSSSPGKFRKAHLPPTPGSSLLNATRLLPLFALSNVAVHNHMLFRFASFVANDAGNGFQHHPHCHSGDETGIQELFLFPPPSGVLPQQPSLRARGLRDESARTPMTLEVLQANIPVFFGRKGC